MNPENFLKEAPGNLINIRVDDSSVWAFCPEALPPKLNIDMDIVNQLTNAASALAELSGLGRALPNPHLFTAPFLRKEAILSSRIEGTQTELDELFAYEAGEQMHLPGMKEDKRVADVREVLNYVRAMEFGVKRINEIPVSLRLMRELHEILLKGVRGEQECPGEFRRIQNYIGPSHSKISEAHFIPPPVPQMKNALNDLEKYIHTQDVYPALIRQALIHYQFETIHPFRDGNGRIGRLLIPLLLISWDLLPTPLLYLSAWFEKHREQYYHLLRKVSQKGAWNEWIFFFLKGVEIQSKDAIQKAKKLQDLQLFWKEKLKKERSTGLAIQVADFFFEVPLLEARTVASVFQVTHQTAMKTINRLIKQGLVKEFTNQRRNRKFFAPDIFNILIE
jgi:Fic family protein